jgi:hypothetical protein
LRHLSHRRSAVGFLKADKKSWGLIGWDWWKADSDAARVAQSAGT